MLLSKRRTPFGWRTNIAKKLLNVERGGAFYQPAFCWPAESTWIDRSRCFSNMICTFCTANKQAFKVAFVSVLQLAQHRRLSKVGTVTLEWTWSA